MDRDRAKESWSRSSDDFTDRTKCTESLFFLTCHKNLSLHRATLIEYLKSILLLFQNKYRYHLGEYLYFHVADSISKTVSSSLLSRHFKHCILPHRLSSPCPHQSFGSIIHWRVDNVIYWERSWWKERRQLFTISHFIVDLPYSTFRSLGSNRRKIYSNQTCLSLSHNETKFDSSA